MGSLSNDMGFYEGLADGDHARAPYEPVAIVGMAMRLPGRVHSGEEFWNMLIEKRSGLCDVPKDRYNIAGFHDPSGRQGTMPMNKAYFLEEVDIRQFDTSVFPISKSELERLDPQQRQLLEVAYECMENAGQASWRGKNIGCYVGVFGEDWLDLYAKETQHRKGYRVTGYGDFVLGNRISYEFDLHGPSMTVKTGCSSSLVCLDLACEAIRRGECDSAMVGGTSLIFSPTMTLALSDQGVLSPSGSCKTFDASADGYGRGEAVNMIFVKKLSQAIRDGDPIRAVIRGTSVNCDGRTNGMITPSPTAQEALIRRTYEVAGISNLSETAVVECHGTGTAVGDPLETTAVARCFGDKGVIITSVKPNVGHSEGAAGLTSLIKSVLALEHRIVPPNINFNTPNPKIPFEQCRLHVPVEAEQWPEGRAERISVNSFGIGGVNAHVILESPQQFGVFDSNLANGTVVNGTASRVANGSSNGYTNGTANGSSNGTTNGYTNGNVNGHTNGTSNGCTNGSTCSNGSSKGITNGAVGTKARPHLLLFSANSAASLEERIKTYQEYADNTKVSLHDLAYSLANRRDHRAYRAYALAGSLSPWQVSTHETVKSAPRVGWVFTGQGAQWPGMGAELIDTNATFRRTIRKLDKFLLSLPTPPEWTIEDELRKMGDGSRVHQARFGHPLSIAVQIALVDVLRSWGIVPSFVLGHSSGEMAAAYASGAITAEGAMAAAAFRGSTNESSSKKGSMAAIGLGRDDMAPYMEPGVVIACENSQCSVTLSGDAEQVEKVVQKVKQDQPGVLARPLRVEAAFHSHHMWEHGPLYEEHIQSLVYSVSPKTPFYSAVTGKRLTGEGCLGPSYWRSNMENPVLFNSSLRSALGDQDERVVLVEIGPHPALKGPIGQILRDIGRTKDVHTGTLQRSLGCEESLFHLAGKLFQQGVYVDYSKVCPPGRFLRDLPRYSWKHDTIHWAEPRMAREWRFREHPPHELLGSRVFESASEPNWRNMLALEDVPWLSGHDVCGEIIFPAAGYISMVGEALRQVEGESTYTLRNIQVAAALVLENDKTAELSTSFKPVMLDASEKSSWWTFTVSSFDGTKWVRHCTGEARASVDKSVSLDAAPPAAPLPRKVDESNWYKVLSRVGFNYSGLFRGMQCISAATRENEAIATVPGQDSNGKFTMHPAVIDQCFQLFTVSAYRGLGRNCSQIAVPAFIEEIVVSPSTEDLHVTAGIHTIERGSFTGDLIAQAGGRKMLSLKGFKASALTSADATAEDVLLITETEWKPHSDFASLGDYMHPADTRTEEWPLLEELALLCILDHCEMLTITDNTPEHLPKFFDWMRAHVEDYRSGANAFVSKDLRLWELNGEQRHARIEQIVAKVSTSESAALSTAVHRLFQNAATIFTGETHPLHILLKDNVLAGIYAVGEVLDYAEAIQIIANTNPHLRILEVGAGTGGTTSTMLSMLRSPHGERLYSSYTFTDLSAGFFSAAKEKFADAEKINYAVLDITRDPAEQGFELGAYDLIIASNVIHATPSLQTSLRHVRSLLSPKGRLFLQELCPDAKFIDYIMGFLSGWWLGAEDNRANQPHVTPERWAQELLSAGFQAPDAIALDTFAPYHASACIIASPASESIHVSRVTLLCHTADGPYVQDLKCHLETRGTSVDICCFGQPHPPSQDIISLLDLQEPLIHELTEESFGVLLGHLRTFNANVIWVTRSSQVAAEDPRAAMVLGLARSLRNEMHLKFYTVEVDSITPTTTVAGIVSDLLLKVKAPQTGAETMDPDWEYAIDNGQTLVPRMHWHTMRDSFMRSGADNVSALKCLDIKTPGLLHTMEWTEKSGSPLKDDEVLVQTRAVGLNFRDVLIALNVLDNSPSEMGLEGCGVVQAVGPSVQHLSVGDRVMYMASGCFATYITLPQTLCVKIDDSMSFEDGAALPCVYATALMALVDKANLQQGQSVLIHSACGGVGLAAIQIAQMIGAEIYCTVGNEEKIQYLVQNHDIDRSHVFNSRDSSFLHNIMRATDNRGVDVVLNSLSGDLLHASWKCVAEFGTMVEIGKRDFRRRAKLSMEAFEGNRTFVGLDLYSVSLTQPKRAAGLLQRCVNWIRGGQIKPDALGRVFPAGEIRDAFRFMQGGRHIGKIIIAMPKDPLSLESTKLNPTPVFRSDRSYLLVGGLGGLGRAVANWMVENGARHLTFLSRSAHDTPDTRGFVEELESQGCEAQLVPGSVSNMTDVEKAVKAGGRPIAGVMNLSMVLRDVSLSDMTFADWTTVVQPKVQGTWNLHNAVSSDLDFFILFSSYSGIVGQWGQANYGAANTFLDAFVQYRHRRGLSASVIDIGCMGDVGIMVQNTEFLDHFKRSGMRVLKEQDLLEAVALAVERSKPASAGPRGASFSNPSQIVFGLVTTVPIASPAARVAWKSDMRMSIYHNINAVTEESSGSSSEENNVKNFLLLAASRPEILAEESAATTVANAIAKALCGFLIKDEESIALEHSTESIGVDSLVAMEVRNWIRQQFGVDTSVFTIVQSPSLLALGDHVRKGLMGRMGVTADQR